MRLRDGQLEESSQHRVLLTKKLIQTETDRQKEREQLEAVIIELQNQMSVMAWFLRCCDIEIRINENCLIT